MVIFVQYPDDVFWLGGFGERSKATHVTEQNDYVAPVGIEDRLAAGRDDRLCDLGREELLKTAHAFDLAELCRDPFLKGFVPRGELGRLRSHCVMQCLDSQH